MTDGKWGKTINLIAMEKLNELITRFEQEHPRIEEERAELYQQRKNFVEYFNEDKLASMSLEEYCGDKGTDWHIFSNGLWKTLVGLSLDLVSEEKDQSTNCNVCGVSYQENEYKYFQRWSNEEEPFEKIKVAIIELYKAAENKDWAKIEHNKLNVWFQIMFLSVYFPDDYLNICKEKYLQKICRELDVSDKGKHFSLQRNLLQFKQDHPIMKNWSLDKYGYFLWNYVKSQTDKKNIETMESSLVTTYKSFLLKNHNMIFTGAPGTGKTFLAKQIAASIIECEVKNLKDSQQFGFVQFHPSYDYTDFVEGLRPSDKDGQEFEYRQGIFKAFCGLALKARNEYIEEHEDDSDGKNAPKFRGTSKNLCLIA